MRELLATVTTKGQVTIPIEVRRLLQLATHEKVAFILQDNQVRLARRGSVVLRTAGMLKTNKPALTAEQEREAAEKAIAEDVVERMKGEDATGVS
ncbi:MAG: AbrB family transcriptional regulator [Dehalococcoidia bacterium]|nr:AbrB family transcriptional regulator [Dehalococcoidia bacterium]